MCCEVRLDRHATREGWLYLAVVLDLFNREIVGWSIKPRMSADMVVDALTMASITPIVAVSTPGACFKTSWWSTA